MLISMANSNVWAYEQLLNINPRIGAFVVTFSCTYIERTISPTNRLGPDVLADVVYHHPNLATILDMVATSTNVASTLEASTGSCASMDIAGAGTHHGVSTQQLGVCLPCSIVNSDCISVSR